MTTAGTTSTAVAVPNQIFESDLTSITTTVPTASLVLALSLPTTSIELSTTFTQVGGDATASTKSTSTSPVDSDLNQDRGSGRMDPLTRTGIIVGAVFGGLALLLIGAVLLWRWRTKALRRRALDSREPLSPSTNAIFRDKDEGRYVKMSSVRSQLPSSYASLGALSRTILKVFKPTVSGQGSAGKRDMRYMQPLPTHKRNTSSMSAHSRDASGEYTKSSTQVTAKPVPGAFPPGWVQGTRGSNYGKDIKQQPGETHMRADSRSNLLSFYNDDTALSYQTNASQQQQSLPLSRSSPRPRSRTMSLDSSLINETESGTGSQLSDLHVINQPPTASMRPSQTYISQVQRSRGTSMSQDRISRSLYHESLHSIESFRTRRDKIRSDPFDLERMANAGPMPTSLMYMHARKSSSIGIGVNISASRATKHEDKSRTMTLASRNNDGVSMLDAGSLGDWSDPGPDIGRPSVDQARHGVGRAL